MVVKVAVSVNSLSVPKAPKSIPRFTCFDWPCRYNFYGGRGGEGNLKSVHFVESLFAENFSGTTSQRVNVAIFENLYFAARTFGDLLRKS